MTPKRWLSPVPETCDLCQRPLLSVTFIDGKVRGGGWALMCERCWALNGGQLGLGVGQRYDRLTREQVE